MMSTPRFSISRKSKQFQPIGGGVGDEDGTEMKDIHLEEGRRRTSAAAAAAAPEYIRQRPSLGSAIRSVAGAFSLDIPRTLDTANAELPRIYADVRHSIDVDLDRIRRMNQLPTFAEDPVAARKSMYERREMTIKETSRKYRFHKLKERLKKARARVKMIRRGQFKTDKEREERKKEAIVMEEHKLDIESICRSYGALFDPKQDENIGGLPSEIARQRLQELGKNTLTPLKTTPTWVKYLQKFTGLFSLLLILAGFMSMFSLVLDPTSTQNIVLGLILWAIAFLNGNIEFFQQRKSEKILAGFSTLAASTCIVFRDYVMQEINAEDLVVGDIVKLRAGDKVPADLRLLKSSSMKEDNSSLTGESIPQVRTVEMTDENPLETRNLAFFGTMVVEGEGIGIVIRTGNSTVIGELATLATETESVETHLGQELSMFVRRIGTIAIIMAVTFFIFGIAIGTSLPLMFVSAIGIFVGNVPQGLPSTVTLLLTMSAKRLARKNVLCKNLESVETLGCTTIIASDKTGTLTQNRMTVVDTWCNGKLESIRYHVGFKGNPRFIQDSSSTKFGRNDSLDFDQLKNKLVARTAMESLLHSCALNSRTTFDKDQDDVPVLEKKALGDASEQALLKFYSSREDMPNLADIRAMYPKVFEIAFNSKNKWQLSVHSIGSRDQASGADGSALRNTEKLSSLKGAPERVFAKCSYIMVEDGHPENITDEWRHEFQEAYEKLASKGERVLGHAVLPLSGDNYPDDYDFSETTIPLEGYIFIGLTGLQDPPKSGVIEAIEKCHGAGIQVSMVTGDHPLTAKSIANQVGIINGEIVDDLDHLDDPVNREIPAVVVEGSKIDTLTEEQWRSILRKKEIVFARTSPQQKLAIVTRFQAAGHTVAVTGDGVNDSPALKKADLGISMGISGSEVSKEAAELVLMDDNFASIVAAIEEGRLIFSNLKKSIAYTVTHTIPEVVPFLLFLAIGLPLPLTSMLVLFIDLGTEIVPALSLAYERPESDLMKRMPRKREDRLVDMGLLSFSYLQAGIIESLGALFAYFVVFLTNGVPPSVLLFANFKGWFSRGAPTLNIGGRIYTEARQLQILQTAQSAYFLGMVLMQVANLFNTRSRRVSIFKQGIFRNKVSWIGIVCSLSLTSILLYVPFVNWILQTRPVPPLVLLCYPVWMGIMLTFDQIRKFVIRRIHKTRKSLPFVW